MIREESRNTWGRLGCAMKKKRSPPASQCAIIDENGQRTIISGQEPFQNAAANAVNHRYRGATDAPVNSGQFYQDLGTLADTESAEALLRGDYNFPEECDKATACIFRELAPLFAKQQCPMNVQLENSDFHWW